MEETQGVTQNYHQLKTLNEKLHAKVKKLEEKKQELGDTLKKTNNQNQKMTQEFMKISSDIDKRNDELQEKFLSDNNNDLKGNNMKGKGKSLINREEIEKMCKESLNEFLDVTEENNDSLKIEIVFGKTTLFRNLYQDSLTFQNLKESIKSHLDREINEFYFTDVNNAIYLDDMNVKKALFPLDKVNVVGIMPKLIIKDHYRGIEFNEIKLENLDQNNNEGLNSGRKVNLTFLQNAKRIFKSYYVVYTNIFLNTIFMIFLILFMFEFREMDTTLILMNTYTNDFFETPISNDSNLLQNFENEFVKVFQYPKENDTNFDYSKLSRNFFNIFIKFLVSNKDILFLGGIRILKQETSSNDCRNERIESLVDSGVVQNCIDRDSLQKNVTAPNVYFKGNDKNVKGVYRDYPYEGISREMNLFNPQSFYDTFRQLREENWVNLKTYLVVFEMNLYSINEGKYVHLMFVYEYSKNNFIKRVDVNITHGVENNYFSIFFCVIISFFMLVMEFLQLKKSDKKDVSKDYERNFFIRLRKTYDKNFQRPGMFQFVSFLNILFFLILFGYRLYYFSSLIIFNENEGLVYNTNSNFISLEESYTTFQYLVFLINANFLIFIFTYINNLKIFSFEFDIIQRNLAEYFLKIYFFDISYLVLFVLFSFYISYYLFGGSIIAPYNDPKYVFMKIFGSFYIGSMDIFDKVLNSAINISKSDKQTFDDPYKFLASEEGISGYIFYSIMFYVITNFLIKTAHSAIFLVIYRDNYKKSIEDIYREKENFEISPEQFLKDEEKAKDD